MAYLWIALGSALGGMSRFFCASTIGQWSGSSFPWGTLTVNIVGSFIIGFIATLTGPDGRFLAPPATRQFLMVGFCGGYTTFSSFSLETLTLLREGDWLRGGGYVMASVAVCLVAVALGHAAAASLNAVKGA